MIRIIGISLTCTMVGLIIKEVFPLLPYLGLSVGLATGMMYLTENKNV